MKYRSFMLILYADDESHMLVLDYIQENIKEYAFILHDRDFNEVGEIKKEHYHVIIKFPSPRSISGLSKELNIKENYIEPTKKSYVYGLRYLIHADDEEKFQYEINDVVGPLKEQLKKSLDSDKTEADYVLEIMSIIDNLDYIYITDFVKIIANSGLWSYYRRNAYTFNQVISEHNYSISNRT